MALSGSEQRAGCRHLHRVGSLAVQNPNRRGSSPYGWMGSNNMSTNDLRGSSVESQQGERRRLARANRWSRLALRKAERGTVAIGSRIPREDFEAAILFKLTGDAWPWKPATWRPHQAL